MRKGLVLLWLVVLSPAFCVAQRADVLLFRETTWDFGTIREAEGPVEHEFIFTNNSGTTLRLVNVAASCGCTTPSWSREPIADGKTGSVRARFDPKGRPGFFAKTITITTDPPTGNTVIQIRGNVSNGDESEAGKLGYLQGSLQATSGTLQMGKVFNNQPAVARTFRIRNGGKSNLQVNRIIQPSHIQVSLPKSLNPGQSAEMVIRYDARTRKTYGYAADQITLITSDEDTPEKHFTVAATLEEYFEPLKPGQQGLVPMLIVSPASLRLGSIASTITTENTITLTNTGRSDLLLRAAIPNCTCITIENLPNRIPPGKSAEVKLRFTPNGRSGRQNKAVLLYSTDPVNPVQRITISADVRNQ